MKKFIEIVLAISMCFSFCSCGSEKVEKFAVGETLATDILEITLDSAAFATALGRTMSGKSWRTAVPDDDYFLPKEYDALKDADNPYVAGKGHTLVAITFTVKNIDRKSVDIGGTFNPTFITVQYSDKEYSSNVKYGAVRLDETNWEEYNSQNILLSPAEPKKTVRCYMDIPVEVENMSDPFSIKFSLPNSEGATTDFVYAVNQEVQNK